MKDNGRVCLPCESCRLKKRRTSTLPGYVGHSLRLNESQPGLVTDGPFRSLTISSLGVDVKPWPPGSDESIFLEEPLRNGVVSKIVAVREAYRVRYKTEWIEFVWKYVLYTPPELA